MLVTTLELVFPNTSYLPATSAQRAVYAAIPGHVALDLGLPERRAGLRLGRMLHFNVPRYVAGNFFRKKTALFLGWLCCRSLGEGDG